MLLRIVVERLSHLPNVLGLVPIARGWSSRRTCASDVSQCWAECCNFNHTVQQACGEPGGLKGRRHLFVLIDGEKNTLHGITPNLADACGRNIAHARPRGRYRCASEEVAATDSCTAAKTPFLPFGEATLREPTANAAATRAALSGDLGLRYRSLAWRAAAHAQRSGIPPHHQQA